MRAVTYFMAFLLLAALPAASSAGLINKKLNPPLDGGKTDLTKLSPDKNWIVFTATGETSTQLSLYSVPADLSSDAILLNGASTRRGGASLSDGDVSGIYISPDSSHVVYTVYESFNDKADIRGVPIDGSAASYSLFPGGAFVSNNTLTDINSDLNVAFAGSDGGEPALYVADVTGAVSSIRVDDSLTSDGTIIRVDFTPDGTRVLFELRNSTTTDNGLYSVVADGSAPPEFLSGTLVSGGQILSYEISPDSSQVFYIADQDTDEWGELYVVPTNGSSSSQKAASAVDANRDVLDLIGYTPDGSYFYYRTDLETSSRWDLYSVKTDLSGSPIKLNPDASGGGNVVVASILDNGDVIYQPGVVNYNGYELYVSQADGSTSPVRLNDGTVSSSQYVTSYRVSPDQNWVAYRSDQYVDDDYEIYLTKIDGSTTPTRVTSSLPTRRGPVTFQVTSYQFTPDSAHLVFAVNENNLFDLYSVPSDLSGPVVRLTEQSYNYLELFEGDFGKVPDTYSTDGRVSFRAYAAPSTILYDVPADGSESPRVLDLEGTGAGTDIVQVGYVDNYRRIVFKQDQDTTSTRELFIGYVAPELVNGIELAPGQSNPATTLPVVFRVEFDETVAFGSSGPDVSGSTVPGTLTTNIILDPARRGFTATTNTYDIEVSGATGSGDIVLTLDPEWISSSATNLPLELNGESATVQYNPSSGVTDWMLIDY